MAVVAGIDGCPSGWVCLTKDLSTGTVQARILATISGLLTLDPRPEVVMVDVPIGLTDAGPRKCDLEARAHLTATEVEQRLSGSDSSNLGCHDLRASLPDRPEGGRSEIEPAAVGDPAENPGSGFVPSLGRITPAMGSGGSPRALLLGMEW